MPDPINKPDPAFLNEDDLPQEEEEDDLDQEEEEGEQDRFIYEGEDEDDDD